MTRIRAATARFLRPVAPFDLRHVEPVSKRFGCERGMPIDRRYIEAFLAANVDRIRGRAMEIASADYIRQFGGSRVTHIEVLHATAGNPEATCVGDLAQPETLPADYLDCFICTQTLNFIYDFKSAIRGLHRILKPGGSALVTLGGISQISRYDMDRWGDYWRLTSKSAALAFGEVFGAQVQVATYGNALAACAFLQGLAVEDLPEPALLDRVDPNYQVIVAVLARKGD
ncbi:MAG: methyltransferase domain-containing protein [Pseudomonadota bacterium]